MFRTQFAKIFYALFIVIRTLCVCVHLLLIIALFVLPCQVLSNLQVSYTHTHTHTGRQVCVCEREGELQTLVTRHTRQVPRESRVACNLLGNRQARARERKEVRERGHKEMGIREGAIKGRLNA